MAVPRVVFPENTEILCAPGLEGSSGLSHACDYPPAVTSLPRLTTPSSGTLEAEHAPDRAVAVIQAGLSAYHLDVELLRTLQPDLIVTQDQAAGCGVSYAAILQATASILGTQVEVLSLHPTVLQDIWDDIHRVGKATQQQRQAATLLEELFARVNTVVAESIMVREPPRVAILVRTAPLMLAGSWAPDLIQLAGGTAGLCRPGAPAWCGVGSGSMPLRCCCLPVHPLRRPYGLLALQGLRWETCRVPLWFRLCSRWTNLLPPSPHVSW